MSSEAVEENPRPGGLRRAAAGAWHVPAGLAYLLRHPRLWPLAALPALVAGVLLVAGFVLGVYAVPLVDDLINPVRGPRGLVGSLIAIVIWVATPLAGLVIGLGVALMVVAPILEQLSMKVEAIETGSVANAGLGVRWEMAQSIRGALYFAVRAPGILLVALVPVVGPPIGALWGAHALAFQVTESALARQGMDFPRRRAWHQRYRAESLGFGFAGLLTLIVPLANVLLAPALVVGATRLVLDLLEYEGEIESEQQLESGAAARREADEDAVTRANTPRQDPWDLPK